MATVVLLGTLDTKGLEYAFLRDRVREHGVDVLLVDAGVMGEPLVEPDVSREEVASAAGVDHAELVRAADRGAAVDAMGRGAAAVLARLHGEGRLDGTAAFAIPAIAPAALVRICAEIWLIPEMSTTEYIIVTSTAPT